MFSIEFIGKPRLYEGELSLAGLIKVGDFSEHFVSPLVYWKEQDYTNSWKKSIGEFIEGNERVALATTMYKKEDANFIFTWCLFRDQENVHVQNKILFIDEIGVLFDENKINSLLGERRVLTEDGDKISEWNTRFCDVVDFYIKMTAT